MKSRRRLERMQRVERIEEAETLLGMARVLSVKGRGRISREWFGAQLYVLQRYLGRDQATIAAVEAEALRIMERDGLLFDDARVN